VKNFVLAMLISIGTPMLLMGLSAFESGLVIYTGAEIALIRSGSNGRFRVTF